MTTPVVYVAWQDSYTRTWYPVGQLSRQNEGFCFVYTEGAKTSKNFTPFGRMQDLDSAYLSDKLFPLFANRLLPKTRPEYRDYLGWLGLEEHDHDELELLARSGGFRATDSLELFPAPHPDEQGMFSALFFSHGIRYLSDAEQSRIKDFESGQPLYLMKDFQNPHDPHALLMRTCDPICIAGYVPRYYAFAIQQLMKYIDAEALRSCVEKVNLDAPAQFRLQCRITAPWPQQFHPFQDSAFQPLATPTWTTAAA